MKFEVGEIAVLAENSDDPTAMLGAGDEVTVIGVGPFRCVSNRCIYDYEIEDASGEAWLIDERYLRKRYQPGSDIARDIIAKIPIREVA